MPGRKVSRTNMGLGVGSYAWSIPCNILFRAVSIILIAGVVRFGSISDQKKASLSLSRFCSAFVQDLGIAMVVDSYEQDRLFRDAVHDLFQALPGIYCGSRDAAVRYIYHGTTLGNFIELKSEQPPMTPAEFFGLLSAVPDVLEVVPHPKSKLEKKNLAITIKNVLSWYTHERTPNMGLSLSSLHTIT